MLRHQAHLEPVERLEQRLQHVLAVLSRPHARRPMRVAVGQGRGGARRDDQPLADRGHGGDGTTLVPRLSSEADRRCPYRLTLHGTGGDPSGMPAVTVALALIGSLVAGPVGAAPAGYEGSVSRLDAEVRAEMRGSSWRPGCPVGFRDLRLVRIKTYVGFDGQAHRGRLVAHRRWAQDLLEVFRRIFSRGFPLRRVRLVDRYGADDHASMRADNTSAFNCRYVAGTTTWSRHALGAAVDVNPVENPYVSGSHVSPPERRALRRPRRRSPRDDRPA